MPTRKLIIVTGLLLVCGLLFANNTDSLAIQKLTEKMTLLESKVEVLNETNNKIISVTWAVIGIIGGLFVIIIGLNFWSNYKLNSQKIQNIKEELKSYLEIELFNKHKEKTDAYIENLIRQKFDSLEHKDKVIEHKITEIKIHLLKKELEITSFEFGYYKIDKLILLLKLYVEIENYHGLQGNSVGVNETLELILQYVKSQKIELEEKKRLLDNLSSLNNGYIIFIEEIKKQIRT